MVRREPDTDPPDTYECYACGHRMSAEQTPLECPACGGRMKNLGKPRI